MRVVILGAGSLGKTYGGLLALAGHDVHYLLRSEYQEIQAAGFYSIDFEAHNYRIEAPQLYQQAEDLPPADLVIIALKTTENTKLPALMKSCIRPNSMVLIVQNGIGNEEYLAPYIGSSILLSAVSSMAAYRENSLCVKIACVGDLKVAPVQKTNPQALKACSRVQQLFSQTVVPITVHVGADYRENRWCKLMWNIPFSSLSVIYDRDVKTLASYQPYVSIVRDLMEEVGMIAAAESIVISAVYKHTLLETTRKLENYYPSMYHDYLNKRAIEREYIIENPLHIAQQHQLKVPMLQRVASHFASITL